MTILHSVVAAIITLIFFLSFFFFFFSRADVVNRGEVLKKLETHLSKTQTSKCFPFEPGAGLYIAVHATFTAGDFFLGDFYPSGPFTCIFSKPSPEFVVFLCVFFSVRWL